MIAERKAELDKIKEAGIMVGTDNKGDATTATDDQGAGKDSGADGKSKAKGNARAEEDGILLDSAGNPLNPLRQQ
jgi:hypothetical protein